MQEGIRMSGDFLFSLMARVGLTPSNLVFRRRVNQSSKNTASRGSVNEDDARSGFKESEVFPKIGHEGLIDEKV